jgi:hypothetical protein
VTIPPEKKYPIEGIVPLWVSGPVRSTGILHSSTRAPCALAAEPTFQTQGWPLPKMRRTYAVLCLALTLASVAGQTCTPAQLHSLLSEVNTACPCGNGHRRSLQDQLMPTCTRGVPTICTDECAPKLVALVDGCSTSLAQAHLSPAALGNAQSGTQADFYHMCLDEVPPTPIVEVYATQAVNGPSPATQAAVAGHTTFRLRLQLGPALRNGYSVFGDGGNLPYIPPALFNSMAPQHTSPPDAMFYNFPQYADLALASFLSVGPDYLCAGQMCASLPGGQATAINTGQVGASVVSDWSATAPLTLGPHPDQTTDFALFWMNPDQPGTGQYVYSQGPLIAQVTLPNDASGRPPSFAVALGVQGRHAHPQGNDASHHVIWAHRDSRGNLPLGYEVDPNYPTTRVLDIDECATNSGYGPCSGVPNTPNPGSPLANKGVTCWNGLNQEYHCICDVGGGVGAVRNTVICDPAGGGR